MLERLKEKSKIDLYIAVVDTTDGIQVADYSQRLAREWNIGSKTSRGKSLLLVISAASKSSFTQYSRGVQADLPDGVLGEMSYRMSGPLSEGRFGEAVETGIYVFVNAVAEKVGFNAADLEKPGTTLTAEGSTRIKPDETQAVLINATTEAQKSRPRVVNETALPAPTDTPSPTPSETPSPTPGETPSPTPERDSSSDTNRNASRIHQQNLQQQHLRKHRRPNLLLPNLRKPKRQQQRRQSLTL